MNAVISYREILDLVEKEFSIRPNLTGVDEKTVEVSYRPGSFMPSVSVQIRVDEVSGEMVRLSYECGLPTSMVIAGLVGHLEDKLPGGIDVDTKERRVNIDLKRFKKLEKVLEFVTLSDIRFGENSADIELTMA